MEKSKMERISFLSRKQRSEGLTDAEKQEQAILRKEYIDEIKGNLKSSLENVYTLDNEGNETKLKKKNK
ncbi:MAG: DUF896 domain-containing protein [Ruminococcaceae bacterium]|nr:DUF896 domain-containing protein [Oscillospiraceae bacterium]